MVAFYLPLQSLTRRSVPQSQMQHYSMQFTGIHIYTFGRLAIGIAMLKISATFMLASE